ncbi:NAD-dependent epimerase/dehydratase family protein [Candidatus Poriferisocius sp.]|uniref:NAD-dependent epimerase/dehydratase family protein n=1 Tax=Candidatus Poriferisocius sp. TaxID=3101276 RepID=UPI003B0189C2
MTPLTVAVVGACGPLGRRVCRRLVGHRRVGSVIGFDLRPDPAIHGMDYVRGNVAELQLGALLADVDVLVHLASALEPWPDEDPASTSDGEVTRRLLQAAGSVGVGRVVLMSTAMVYGAWPDNPVPLTEASPLRPIPEFGFAVDKAEQERFAAQWGEDHPAVDIVTLRPTASLAEDHVGWVARSLRAAAGLTGESEVPVQFLHLDDLAAAVELSVVGDLNGVYNVAPEGWTSSGATLDLEGLSPRVRMPEQMLARLSGWWWKYRLGSISPGVLRYARFPWVVASDRLRAAGWTPQHTSELALVSGGQGQPWGMLDSHRRQQIALGGAAAGGLALAWGIWAAARWLFRR